MLIFSMYVRCYELTALSEQNSMFLDIWKCFKWNAFALTLNDDQMSAIKVTAERQIFMFTQ